MKTEDRKSRTKKTLCLWGFITKTRWLTKDTMQFPQRSLPDCLIGSVTFVILRGIVKKLLIYVAAGRA